MIHREHKGWLGIDIGTASVKVAQLARAGDRLRVLAAAQVPRSSHIPAADSESAQPIWSAVGEIRTAVAMGETFRGRHAAAIMPMGFCDVHQVSNLVVEDDDLEQEVRNAIETVTQCSADNLEFDIWPAGPAGQQRWNVLAVGRPWSDRIYYDVVESGFACHTIDGVPQALARAVNLSAADISAPTAVLDWGFSQSTFCLVADQHPVYVRVLKDCSLQATLSTIADELGISLDEASVLADQHGVRGTALKTEDDVASLITDLLAEPLRHLEGELAKTLAHVATQYRDQIPRQLVLFGGGALVRGLPQHLASKLRLETRIWSFDHDRPESTMHDPLFGVSLALSALAWEDE